MSSKGYKRTITLDFDYTQVKDGVPAVSRNMKQLDATFQKSSLEIQKYGKESEQLRLKQDMLTQKIGLQTKKVEELKKQYEQSSEKSGEHSKKTENLKKEYTYAEVALAKFKNQLDDTNKEIAKQSGFLGETIRKIDDFKAQAKEAGVDIDKMADSFIKIGTALVGIATAATVMRTGFDKEMAKVRTIADTSVISFNELQTAVIKTSNNFNIPANEVAGGLYELISANTKTENSFAALNNSALLARGGLTDMNVATDILTSITNAYNLTIEEQADQVNKLVLTQKIGKVEMHEFGDGFGRIAGKAATLKIPLEEIEAAIATLTLSGMGVSEAFTALDGVLSNVIKTSGPAREEASRLRLKFDAAALSSKGLAGFLDNVRIATNGDIESMAKLFGSVTAVNAVTSLTGPSLELFKDALNEINASSNEAAEAFEALQTPGEQLDSAINKLKNSLIEAGDAFAPVIKFLADFITAVSDVAAPLVVFAGIIGGIMILLGGLVKTYALLKSATVALTAAKSALAVVQGLLAGTTAISSISMTQFLGIILLVAAAIAIIIGLIMLLSGNFDKAKKSVDELSGSVRNVTSDLGKISSTTIAAPTANRSSVNDSMSNLYNSTQNLPRYAYGTSHHPGGLALVGEKGAELVDMPQGSKVYTADQTRQMLSGGDFYEGDVYLSINMSFDEVDELNELISMAKSFRQQRRAMTGRG